MRDRNIIFKMILPDKKNPFAYISRCLAGAVFVVCFLFIFSPQPVSATQVIDPIMCAKPISLAVGGIIKADQASHGANAAAAMAQMGGLSAIPLTDVAAQNATDYTLQTCMSCCNGGSLSIAGTFGFLSQTAQQCFEGCQATVAAANTSLQDSTAWKVEIKRTFDQKARDVAQQVLAVAFKTSLKTFARTVAHDTAVWVASGGRGQKPLFITEGWGAYMQNAADTALGDFIDGVGSKFGMDLCQPNLQVKLAIKAGLDYEQPRRVRCSFSKIMSNWQSAINSPTFPIDYKESLRPGANDVSFALIMADQRNTYVSNAAQKAAKDAETQGMWKSITNVAGQILTPGTVIADTFREKQANADIGFATFTNTVADIVQEFVNTLVSQLIKNLQSGLFSGSGNNNNNTSGFSPDLSGLAALFNPNSSPVVSGIAGATLAFSSLIEGQTKVGGNVDILLKLSTCSDAAKANPGPTDCVMDSLFAEAVKGKKYVTDLDPSVKNRLFAPQINQKASLENVISSRSIMIMREYSIVPVGWEFAAEVIKKATDLKPMTLNDVMNCFYGGGLNGCSLPKDDDRFKGLVDPYWVLKAPETFCRRVGYTGFNSFNQEQGGNIVRNQDCVDEQQCLQEDGQGNCLNYGYCTQDRRTWDIGKTCEAKYNTCSTYTSRAGLANSWLTDSLDFSNCTSGNAGCRSYATNFNYQSKQWNGDVIKDSGLARFSELLDATLISTTPDPGWQIKENHTVSENGRLALGSQCTRANCGAILGCKWNLSNSGNYCTMTASCDVPAGGVSCYADSCYETANELASLNPDFTTQAVGNNPGDAKYWTDELSYSNINNRHYRATGQGRTGFGLKAVSANNPADLITTLPDIAIDPGQSYKLKFSIKGSINQGSIVVAIVAGDSPYHNPNSAVALGGGSFQTSIGSWTDVELPIINSGKYTAGTIVILTPIGSITDINLDDFSLLKLKSQCSAAGVQLFSVKTDPIATEPSNIYFNRNAQTCSSADAGCSQFIRAKDRLGNNPSEKFAYINQAPDYFHCYLNQGGAWPTTAFELNNIVASRAPECSGFAGVCLPSEVGCELYTPVGGDPQIPGIVDGLDLCPQECSGYQVYKQEATNFIASSTFKQFIADKNAKYCSAAYAGCDEFTNLDELGRGAENKDYYVNFKVCQRPASDDAAYYTWEGSDITGYQLKAFSLKKSNILDSENLGNGYAPCTNLLYNADGSNRCEDATTAGICAQADMAGNSDCRELYDTDGNVHYRLLSKTVTVSDNCHPYRRTQTEATVIEAQTDCLGSHGWWKDATHECIYMAIPQEGALCSKEVAGCRSYTGNRGNNVRNVLSASDFTSGTTSDNLWLDGNNGKDGIMISSEATYPGGNSLTNKVNAVDGLGVTNNIIKHQVRLLQNHTYILSFWAKGNKSFNPDSILFTSGINNNIAKDKFATVRLAGNNLLTPQILIGTDWQRYDLGPVFVTWEPTDNDYLSFNLPNGAKIYLDNIILKELNDNVYAVENSWYTPVSCDNKLDDGDGQKAIVANNCQDESTGRCSVGEMLGCTAYKDRASAVWYLRSFNSLCRRQAVGCEALISTHNSESALAESFNVGPDIGGIDAAHNTGIINGVTKKGIDVDKVTIPADNLVYLVNDGSNTCSASNKGCSAFGLPLVDKWDAVVGYQTVFLINDPARYPTDLCKNDELWCNEFATNNSLQYFKDPHGKTCDYVSAPGQASGWYKTGTTQQCSTDANNDAASNILKTTNGGSPDMSFGTGYAPAQDKIQPVGPYADTLGDWGQSATYGNKSGNYNGFAGNCPITSSGCSEYIDPNPGIYTNYLSPKDFGSLSVGLKVDGYTLYNLTNVTMTAASPCQIYRPYGTDSHFYYLSGADSCDVTVIPIGDPINANSKLSKAGVSYALAGSVDNSSCNGNVDFKSGCILMNARNSIDYNQTSTNDRDYKYLTYDSTLTYPINNANGGANPASPQMATAGGVGDSGSIIKAGANRTCEKWLQCTTYQKSDDSSQSYRFDNQDQCLNFAICDFRDADGSCRRFETADTADINKTNTAFPNNLTGYTIPNSLPVAAMDQFGNSASVPNSNFESTIDGNIPGEPLGWIMNAKSADLNNDGWKIYKYAVDGQAQYAKFDTGYLSINSIYSVTSESIDVQKGYYALDLWVNTQDLKPESATARIFITSEKINEGVNNISIPKDSGLKHVTMDEQTWLTSDSLKLPAGSSWTEKTVLVNAANIDTIKIKLMNFDDEIRLTDNKNLDTVGNDFNYHNCYDLVGDKPGQPDSNTPCNITGSSLFDNVSLKAALRTVNSSGAKLNLDNLPAPNELISRSCRAYPAQDARSCQYFQNNNFYYGWYGYCLMNDPDNPGQCLQWYPIDQLKGDVVDEYSGGYSDRIPLFYCAEVKKNTVYANINDGGLGISADFITAVSGKKGAANAGSLNSLAQSVTKLVGDSGKAISFSLSDPATERLFRYPMIQKFGVASGAIGGGVQGKALGFGIMAFLGTMEKNYSCFTLNIGGYCDHAQSTVDTTPGVSTPVDIGGTTVSIDIVGILQGLINSITGLDTDRLFSLFRNRISTNSVWGGWGAVVSMVFPVGGTYIGVGLPFATWDGVESQVMNSGSGSGSALSSILKLFGAGGSGQMQGEGSVMGAKIVTDEDSQYAGKFTDPNTDISGNILGAVWGVRLGDKAGIDVSYLNINGSYDAYYCSKVVQLATATGLNKAWVTRVSQASQFTFLDSDKGADILKNIQMCRINNVSSSTLFFLNPYCLNVAGALDDIDPANLGYQFYGYNADYKPFGAIVAPQTDLQNPHLWDSYSAVNTTDFSRQPIYWEPPTLSGSAPYQARMGQPESPAGLQNLFAKSYAAWQWVGDDQSSDSKSALKGSYQPINQQSDSSDYSSFIWDTPNDLCDPAWIAGEYKTNGYVRAMNDRAHYRCKIKPEIITMKVNGFDGSTGANLIDNNSPDPDKYDSANDQSLSASRPAKLDFTVRVDRDQLPLTSYLVEWGDGDLFNTSVTGVKLRARTTAENPFTLYHLYDYQKVFDSAKTDGCTGIDNFSGGKCALHYCDSLGKCFVKINVTVTDNWRAYGNLISPFKIQVK